MPTITLSIDINAPQYEVFDAARNIDLHQMSMDHTEEKAIAGRTSGLIQHGETVTWQARHFGVMQELTVEITEMKPHITFTDEMIKGTFHSFKHIHTFSEANGVTTMKDEFTYKSPYGIIGQIVDFLVLKNYMTEMLTTRNHRLKEHLESDRS